MLRRFSITCYGHQESLEEIKSKKALKYKELKNSKNKKLFDEYFLSYKPDIQEKNVESIPKNTKTIKKNKKIRKTKKIWNF